MKLRIKFSKKEYMKFIGHLDLMRFFQKAIRRADIDIAYSTGYSPHQVMSFAAPLGVGLTSDGEYLDIEVNSADSSEAMKRRLNAALLTHGIEVVSVRRIPDPGFDAQGNALKDRSAMAMVAGADYDLVFKEGHEPEDWDGFCDAFDAFCALEQITVLKATKKSSLTADIRPMIKSCRLDRKSRVITMSLSTGSSANLKPELVMEAFYKGIGSDWDPAVESYQYSMQINRRETYALGENGEWIALEALGEVIE